METTKTTYDVRVVGKLWMPMATAAKCLTVSADDLPKYTRADNETPIDYEVRMVQCATDKLGDFSSVTAWDIRRVVTHETFTHQSRRKIGDLVLDYVEKLTRFTDAVTLVSFDDDAETAWMDCQAEPEWAE